MDTEKLSKSYRVDLPAWVADEIADDPEYLPTVEDRMRLVNRLAARNVVEGSGGPFAAVVVEARTGRLVSVGVNAVLASDVSSAHAEMVALGLAQTRLGSWDLGGEGLPEHEIVVNWRPCVQCYGGVLWSGVRRLVIAGSGPELEELTTFDEGPMREDWNEQFARRGIEVVDGVLRDEALAVYAEYRERVDRGDVLVYNARAASA